MIVTPELLAAAAEIPFENCTLATALAERMRTHSDELTRRWLDRISARVKMDPNRIFPTDAPARPTFPLLILGIADYIENPERSVITFRWCPSSRKAMELGELRFSQGVRRNTRVLKEYEIFGGILFSFLGARLSTKSMSHAAVESCCHVLTVFFWQSALIQQATLTHYLSLVKNRLNEREQRLRGLQPRPSVTS